MSILPEHCRLNERKRSHYYQVIVNELFTDIVPSEHPRVVLLGGQPGSGKTKMRELANEQFPSVTINADDLRDYHPMYRDLKLSEPDRASFLVNEDVSKWTGKLILQAVEERRNIVFDGTFGTSDQNMIRETLQLFQKNGYESQLWVLAVPAAFSRLGIYLRHEMQIRQSGSGRFVSMKVHDLNYRNIPANIKIAVNGSFVDQIYFFRRSVEQVNGNFVNNRINLVHSLSKGDADYSKAADVFLRLRDESLSSVQKSYFSVRLKEIVSMIDKRISHAFKANDTDKLPFMAQYKDQFLMDLGMNKNGNQEIIL